MKQLIPTVLTIIFLVGCSKNEHVPDAMGTFEAREVIVSAEGTGKILALGIEEGSLLNKDAVVGRIDPVNVSLQREQVEASIQALQEKTVDVNPQVQLLRNQLAVQQTQVNNLVHERQRIENLLKQDAATGKQLDDITFQLETARKQMQVTQQQVAVQQNAAATQNRSVLSEAKPLSKKVAQLNDQINKTSIINPITGTVLTKYAEEGEITAAGKALYKIADLSYLELRAFISGSQLSQIKTGQQVRILIDDGNDKYKELSGTITWIADQAEFTPKTIQTKDERANLVYAFKVKVKNDGFLKIGMYGEVFIK